MIDRNYLNHDLIDHPEYNGDEVMTYFICKKCRIFVNYIAKGTFPDFPKISEYRYSFGWFQEIKTLDMTCEEIIIKGLLE